MRIGIPKEVDPDERRVGGTPTSAAKYIALGHEVQVQSGAGVRADFSDQDYREVGAEVVDDPALLWSTSDIVLKVNAPAPHPELDRHEAELMREGGILVSMIDPARNKELLDRLAARKATVLAVDQVPRITRAQKMDVLSSMANIAGYRAVIESAHRFGSFFTGQITAAGKVPPATVLIIGAGVAGLAAIGAARGLGARVKAFDVRPAVKDEVGSLGAEFLELTFDESGEGEGGYAKIMSQEFIDAEMALFREQAPQVDILITTAAIPGRKAPVLWLEEHVKLMKRGSIIVDLAAATGGNCELTETGKTVERHGVTIVGRTDLISHAPNTASRLFSANLRHLVQELGPASDFKLDMNDQVVRGCTVLLNGETMWPPPRIEEPKRPSPPPEPPVTIASGPPVPPVDTAAIQAARDQWLIPTVGAGLIGLWVVLKLIAGDAGAGSGSAEFLQHLTVFVLSVFVGWQVVWNVVPALHTPLMSVTNAISGIIIVGGLIQMHGSLGSMASLLGLAAVLLAMINVAGGFLVSQRMLKMFRK